MGKTTKMNSTVITKVTSKKKIKDYANDPYLIEKREIAAAFLKEAGLPKSFTKSKGK